MEKIKLSDCTYANTPSFNFKGKVVTAKCVKVYDGDTITVVFDMFGEYYRFNVRMDGYDSPEIKSKEKDPEMKALEKKWAREARDFLADMILNKIVILTCRDYDKYGRILGAVSLGDVDINNTMLTRGYCRKYDEGHKEEWDFSAFENMYMENNKK